MTIGSWAIGSLLCYSMACACSAWEPSCSNLTLRFQKDRYLTRPSVPVLVALHGLQKPCESGDEPAHAELDRLHARKLCSF
jgi:hypothetical protein